MIVYKITNNINGKIYIGLDSSVDHHRWYYHRWAYNKPHVADYDKRLYRAFRKHGVEHFSYEVLFTGKNRQDIISEEARIIGELCSFKKEVGYNVHGNPAHQRSCHKEYRFKSPDCIIYENVTDLPLFCVEHNLSRKSMYSLAAEKATMSSGGWQCAKQNKDFPDIGKRIPGRRNGFKHSRKRSINSKTNIWTLARPDGTYIEVENLKRFCNDEGLSYRCMLAVSAGSRDNHRNWKIVNKKRVFDV